MNNEDLTPHGNLGWQQQQNTTPPNDTNTTNYAIISMIIGIVSLLFMCIPPVQLVLGVLAIMFAFLSKKNNRFINYAMAGVAIGSFSCIASFYMWAIVVNNLSDPQYTALFNEVYKNLEQIYGTGYQQ